MKRTHLVSARFDWVTRFWLMMLAGAVCLTALVMTSLSAGAVSQRVKDACRNDYYRHCPSYAIGSPQLRTCMTKAGKRKQLTRKCLRALIDTGEVPRKYLRKL